MSTTMVAITCGIAAGLAVTELSAFVAVLARRIVGWSARRSYAHDPAAAEEYAEEWAACIAGRTSNLAKLGTALTFLLPALAASTRAAVRRLRKARARRTGTRKGKAAAARATHAPRETARISEDPGPSGHLQELWYDEVNVRSIWDADPPSYAPRPDLGDS
ncbi:hypothetical protein AGRA3207_000446 [Actinomadura graeca]|uniref:Uncharacterized protein n=1 Tax=Actinomadura graeca TaxID=2750812 RepID=A0ABX8QM98_9ACTN|nr:hypothetical protein [Actinomadura graeca]QXJ19844.1 hypothetical protein AGRA3207_000446 [Actinomadura graeca]